MTPSPDTRTTLRTIYPFVFRYKKRITLVGLTMALGVLLQLPTPLITMYIIDHLASRERLGMVAWLCLTLVGVLVLRSALSVVETYLNNALRLRIVFDVKTALYERLLRMGLDCFHKRQTGYLISRISGDVEGIQSLFAPTLFSILRSILTFLVGLVMVYWLNVRLAIAATVLLPLYLLTLLAFNKRVRSESVANRESYANVYKFLQEHISGVAVTKAFVREQFDAKQMVAILKDAIRGEFRVSMVGALSSLSSNCVASLGPILLLWLGIVEIAYGRFSLGGLIAFNSFLMYLFGPMGAIAGMNVSIQGSLACAKRISEFITEASESSYRSGELTNRGHVAITRGEVEFKEVTFAYSKDGPTVLNSVSFRLSDGTFTAIVGRSGAGKSSIANLLFRFYDYDSGEIFIDGRHLRSYDPKDLRRQVGLVSQETFLFGYSILENIKLGNLHATDAEVIEASKAAYAHEFIMNLPEQYETRIGERGALISGGERQRIALARVFLKQPKIVILDEATSSLDSESEHYVRLAMEKLFKVSTVIVITHRLSTIVDADQIVVVDNGTVVGSGRHEYLYESNSLYHQLCDEQQVGAFGAEARTVSL